VDVLVQAGTVELMTTGQIGNPACPFGTNKVRSMPPTVTPGLRKSGRLPRDLRPGATNTSVGISHLHGFYSVVVPWQSAHQLIGNDALEVDIVGSPDRTKHKLS
jgi:hypothetical protein